MAMGLPQVNYCDSVVFTFKCMIITRVKFDIEYFEKLILKLNEFDKNFMLPGTFLQRQIKMKTSTRMLEVVSLLQRQIKMKTSTRMLEVV